MKNHFFHIRNLALEFFKPIKQGSLASTTNEPIVKSTALYYLPQITMIITLRVMPIIVITPCTYLSDLLGRHIQTCLNLIRLHRLTQLLDARTLAVHQDACAVDLRGEPAEEERR